MKEFVRNLKRVIPGRTSDTMLVVTIIILWVIMVVCVTVVVTK